MPFAESDKKRQEIQFINGDAGFIDWHDADVVFINISCIDSKTMDKLLATASRMRMGAFVIIVTRKISSKHFQLVDMLPMTQSWGISTVRIYKRL